MKINVNTKAFIAGLSMTRAVIRENKIRPILSCVFIETENDCVKMRGSNLDATIDTKVQADIKEHGIVAVQPILMEQFLRSINDEYITIYLDGNILKVEKEDGDVEFPTQSVSEIPNIKIVTDYSTIEMSKEVVLSALQKTFFATDKEGSDSPLLNSVRVIGSGDTVNFLSTDTFRLVSYKKILENKPQLNFDISLPIEAILILKQIIQNSSDELNTIYFNIDTSGRYISFVIDNTVINTKLLELHKQDFISLIENVKNGANKEITVNIEVFTNLLKRAYLFAKENQNIKNSAKFIWNGNKCEVKTYSDVGRFKEKFPITKIGDDLEIVLNIKFILDYLQQIDSKNELLVIRMTGSVNAVLFELSSNSSEDYKYIVMPSVNDE